MNDAPKANMANFSLQVAMEQKIDPYFAEGIYQGIGQISQAFRRLENHIDKEGDEAEARYLALSLSAVAFRFARGDYEAVDNC